MGVMGVAMIPLALSAAICCICTAATVATGDKYADWATRACCWTSCRQGRKQREEGDGGKEKTKRQLKGYGKKRERKTKREEKNERKGQGDGVMEEQMNRDLITRPLCPESVG